MPPLLAHTCVVGIAPPAVIVGLVTANVPPEAGASIDTAASEPEPRTGAGSIDRRASVHRHYNRRGGPTRGVSACADDTPAGRLARNFVIASY